MKKIVVAVRCYNEEDNIESFLHGYDFADKIIISDGGSTDRSLEIIEKHPLRNKIKLLHFEHYIIKNGERWNEDAPHMNFVLDAGKAECPEILIFDDMDDFPNYLLRQNARDILEKCDNDQVNAFRVYMWGDKDYYPHMNRNFNPDYRSIWGWNPNKINIYADVNQTHGTILGLSDNIYNVELPNCLLHKSWNDETIRQKIERYEKIGIAFEHPDNFAGERNSIKEWMVE